MNYQQHKELFGQFEERVARLQALCEEHAPSVYPSMTRYSIKDPFDDDWIALEWEEYWNYGGYEHHSKEIPSSWFDESDETVIEILKEQERKAQEKKEEKEREKAEQELKMAHRALERAQQKLNDAQRGQS